VVKQKGVVVPEILDRPVRDAFIKELGNRGLRVTRSFATQIDQARRARERLLPDERK